MKKLYTIGHSTHSNEYFLTLLKQNQINCVIDVRSMPYSKYASQYNRDELKKYLKNNGLFYIFMGKEFGARQTDKSLFSSDGYVDFEKVIKTPSFKNGMDRVYDGLQKGFNIAFMCAEKDPMDCHRNILVARAFYVQNCQVVNILNDGRLETQEEVYQRLLDYYFPTREQRTIMDFLDGEKSENELIQEALRLRNKKIAYSEDESEAVPLI